MKFSGINYSTLGGADSAPPPGLNRVNVSKITKSAENMK
jgi:hypothetical protein